MEQIKLKLYSYWLNGALYIDNSSSIMAVLSWQGGVFYFLGVMGNKKRQNYEFFNLKKFNMIQFQINFT